MTALPSDSPSSYGHYEVERLLGRGAMGTVYLARDRRIGRRVALKTIRVVPEQFSDEDAAGEFFGRLQREAEVCGSLLHPNIVTLYEAGYEQDRISYLAMELVEGETLLAAIKRGGGKIGAVDESLRVAEDVLRALVHAHARGIIHRDIKPANILIATDGTAKLADFGIARPQDSSMTGAGALLGTPNYMAPEQVVGKQLSTKADLFSLGVVLYEMLTGVKPFAASELTTILHNILRQEVANASDLNPAVPLPVGDLIARLMAKSPEARPTAAEALAEVAAMRKASEVVMPSASSFVETVPSSPIVLAERPLWRRNLRPLYAAMIIAAVLALAAIPAAMIARRTDATPTVTIPQTQLAEFRAKRQALQLARDAYDARQFEESLRLYESYLAKYPHSTAALEGRDAARAALEAEARAKPVQGVRKPPPPKRKEDEDISPSELLRRIFRRKR